MILLGVTRVQGKFNEHIVHTNLKYVMHLGTECLVEIQEGVWKVRIADIV